MDEVASQDSSSVSRSGVVYDSWLALRNRLTSPPMKDGIWLSSFVVLGAADIASIAANRPGLASVSGMLGLSGGSGMLVTSTHDLKVARTLEDKLDSANDLAWGAQGLLYLSSSPGARALSAGLGVIGATIQTGVGARRIHRGLLEGDSSQVKLGALDLGGGLMWLAWEVVGWSQPIFVGSYVVLMVCREGYAKRTAVAAALPRLKQGVRRACSDLRSGVRAIREDGEDMIRLGLGLVTLGARAFDPDPET